MTDPRIERLADVLVSYSIGVRPGDRLIVDAPSLAAPLVREIYRLALRAGGHPEARIMLDGAQEALLALGSDGQLEWVSPRLTDAMEAADARIAVLADANTRALSGVDPQRQARLAQSRAPLLHRVGQRHAAGEYRWSVTAYPTQAAAQEARMSLAAYEHHVYRAALLDRDDPVAAWRALGSRIRKLVDWLGGVRELRIVAEETDLRVGVEGGTWIVCDGMENMPDGEVFTAPLVTSVEGVIRFTYPAVFRHRAVADVRLRFREGEVVEATASRGQDFLEEMLGLDDGARRVGEFAFGLNDAVTTFTGEALLDEKIGGTVHLALGEAYPESGGTNTSALHWDLVCDLRRGGEVYADGNVVYRDGRFTNGAFS
jgi:aminopeptidase